jgi:2-keto-4-pentenoate hydratase/2-oxohepta-3-ene-1,7-dioic acid hydratase in catechol pathway
MRWLRYTANQTSSWSIVEGDRVIAVEDDPFGDWRRRPQTYALGEVKIELPLVPRTFYCAGLDYLKHLEEAAGKRGEAPKIPDRSEVGYRAQNALIGAA